MSSGGGERCLITCVVTSGNAVCLVDYAKPSYHRISAGELEWNLGIRDWLMSVREWIGGNSALELWINEF